MTDLEKIAKQMQEDWDRRISHDYRFWMSDGYRDDQAMWQAGERDFNIICAGLENTHQLAALDLGCGVGRLLKTAASRFHHVVGIDVSNEALTKAREFLSSQDNVEVVLGNGVDLSSFSDSSLDIVYSFAALTSVPSAVAARYIGEVNRILRDGGIFRLQFYLGAEQQVRRDDTLHLRCYQRGNFERAAQLAGFRVQYIEELVLPFQVSFTSCVGPSRRDDETNIVRNNRTCKSMK